MYIRMVICLLPDFFYLSILQHELTCSFVFSPLDYLLSNNYVNSIIVHKFDFSDEEIMAYYISFLKTLSLKLNNHTVHFFYNEVSDCWEVHLDAKPAGQSSTFCPGGLLSVYKALMCLFFLISIATLLGLDMLTFFNLINYLSISYIKFNYCKLRAVYLAGRSAWKLTWGPCYPVGKTGSPFRPSLPLPCCVTLEKTQSSKPQFLPLRDGDDNIYLIGFLQGLN